HRRGGVVRDLFLGVERGAVVGDRQLVVVEQDWREVSPKLRDDILRVERTQRQLPVVVRDEGRASLPDSRWSRTHVPGEPITLRTTTGDRDLFQLAGHRRAVARPGHTLPEREGAQAALPELAVQGALIVLGLRSQLLPGSADAPERGLDLGARDAMAVIDNLHLVDGLSLAPLEMHRHRVGFGVDGVPDQLNDSAQRVTFVCDAGYMVVAGLQSKFCHE